MKWIGEGPGNYSGGQNPARVTMWGPVNETGEFASLYVVTVSENGLPAGTAWSVTFDGETNATTNAEITFPVLNGTFTGMVGNLSGYNATPRTFTVLVSGSAMSVAITFTMVPHPQPKNSSSTPTTPAWEIASIAALVGALIVAALWIAVTRLRKKSTSGKEDEEESGEEDDEPSED